jgi:putative DNA primase/helicase
MQLDRNALCRIAALIGAAVVKKPERGASRKGRDTSRSAAAFRLGADLIRAGTTFEEMCDAIRTNPETAAWCREKGQANNARELHRIWRHAGGDRPQIRIRPGMLDVLADEAEDALIDAGVDIYQRGGALVRPAVTELPAADGGRTMSAVLHRLTLSDLVDAFCETAAWMKHTERDGWQPANPPSMVAAILLGRVGKWRLPVVRGILTAPSLRPDGSLLADPGYDEATGYYLQQPSDLVVPAIPECPSRADAEAGLSLLLRLLDEFPFVDDTSRSVGLSALITPVVRAALTVAPLHAMSAPAPGTGKSYLLDVSAAITIGDRCPVIAAGTSAEEAEKRLNGLLLDAVPIFSLDNVEKELGGELLCQATERPVLTLRRLGKSDMHVTLNAATIGATANNLVVRGDLIRRVVKCSMDANVERPEARGFRGNPFLIVRADRGKFIAAILTLVRAYLAHGEDEGPPLYPVASYEGWTRFVRAPLTWLGQADPADTLIGLRDDDPVLLTLRAVITAWEAAIGLDVTVTAAEVIQKVKNPPAAQYGADAAEHAAWLARGVALRQLRDTLAPVATQRGELSAQQLGFWLRASAGRIVANRRFERRFDAAANAARWRLTEAVPKP